MQDERAYRRDIRRMPEGPARLVISDESERRKQRSLDQNAYWWSVPVAILADHCGYEPDQMHYVLLGEWRGYVDGSLGKVPRCTSSSKLSTAEFTELIEWVQRWAAMELNVQIPAPNEAAA